MKKVLVLVSDKNYLEHAKSLFYAAKTVGKWDGDFCLIANNINEKETLTDFINFGVEIIHKEIDNYYYANYFIFDFYMKKWDYVIYMDCDFTIFGNLNDTVSDDIKTKKVLSVDIEPFFIHEYFCQGWEEQKKDSSLEFLKKDYDLDKKGFNAGYMEFNTKLIEVDTLKKLINLSDKLQPINNHTSPKGSDQPIFNLYFENYINYIKNKKVSFWKDSNQDTIAQHHCRWEAPWVNSNFSERLKKTYLENYKMNLNNFYVSINKF
jgi:hypothetical protein